MGREETKKALDRYYSKLLVEAQPQSPKTPNKKPEKEVQAKIHAWLKAQGFFVFRVEAKQVFDPQTGRSMYSETTPGVSDLLAVSLTGQFLAVEVKSTGRRGTLRYSQRSFLLEVIARNGFAVCSDSVSHLISLWARYNSCEPALKKALLLADIPKERVDDSPLF